MPRILNVEFMNGPCKGRAVVVEVDWRGATLRYGPDDDGPYLYLLEPQTNQLYYQNIILGED